MDQVYFRDKRVAGTKDLFKQINSFDLDGKTSIFSAFSFLRSRKKLLGEKLDTLYILAHGISSASGGFSGKIELGKENLTMINIAYWYAIRDLVKKIVVYACKAAQTPAGKKGTVADGRLLMQNLAITTNADVYASDTNQTYVPDGMKLDKWKGKVFRFTPKGKVQQVSGIFVRAVTGETIMKVSI